LDLSKKKESFLTHVDSLKNESMLKLPEETRKLIFLELRKEEEAKKRDDYERERERRK